MRNWPVGEKCRLLLAGAARLLDSRSPEFYGELKDLLARSLERLAGRASEMRKVREQMLLCGIVGESAPLMNVFRAALQFSRLSNLPVLITGETGTGKELMARAIAKLDRARNAGPFLSVNCAAISPSLMEAEFFGHRRGAFTGAGRERKGLIRSAEGGVLFLDEIGELDLGFQAKLLRALQERRVLALGDDREAPVNVRFIAATNRDLEARVRSGAFRADLFHRLRVLPIQIPPLRERVADILPLIRNIIASDPSFQNGAVPGVSEDFLEALRHLDFPGNVRQLENLVRQALVNHRGPGDLSLDDLPPEVLRELAESSAWNGGAATAPAGMKASSAEREAARLDTSGALKELLDGQGWNLATALRECERRIFQAAMERSRGNQTQAAHLLGITPRSVYNKARKHGLPGFGAAGGQA